MCGASIDVLSLAIKRPWLQLLLLKIWWLHLYCAEHTHFSNIVERGSSFCHSRNTFLLLNSYQRPKGPFGLGPKKTYARGYSHLASFVSLKKPLLLLVIGVSSSSSGSSSFFLQPPHASLAAIFQNSCFIPARDSLKVSSAVIHVSQHGCAPSSLHHNTVVLIDGFCSSGVIYIRWLYAFYCNASFSKSGVTIHTGSDSIFSIFSLRYTLLPRVCHHV